MPYFNIIKALIISLFCLFTSLSYSQKKELYFNDDLESIKKSEFYNITSNKKDFLLKFESDSSFVNFIVLRDKNGQIKLSLLDSIKSFLGAKSQQKINNEDVLIVNYYPGNDPCSTPSYKLNFKKKYLKYGRKIDKLTNVKQFFIYKSQDEINKFGKPMRWLHDDNKLIERTFFPIPSPCGGFVFIKNDGTYLVQRGEYCYSKIFVEELITFLN